MVKQVRSFARTADRRGVREASGGPGTARLFFRPCGAWDLRSCGVPRLAPWAMFLRRSAATGLAILRCPTAGAVGYGLSSRWDCGFSRPFGTRGIGAARKPGLERPGYSRAPRRGWGLAILRCPTAGAVGFVFAPLRGWGAGVNGRGISEKRRATCPLTGAPSPVGDGQLDELGIKLKAPAKA